DDSNKCRQASQDEEQNTEKHTLTGAALAAEVIARNHAETRSRIVFAVHPGNGEEMRQLPLQKNYEKAARGCVDYSSSCCPADHWRCWARGRRPAGCPRTGRL